MIGFVDVDWTGSTYDRSASGYCISLRDNLNIWKSKKQNVVASADAKYRAVAKAITELMWEKM